MISPNKMNYLRSTPGEKVVRDYADFTRGQFKEDGLPVVIAARNEEVDLPATLLALADSHDAVMPIVVENGSNDRTQEFASAMGAKALTVAAHKMGALQLGISHALTQEKMGRSVLFTDADTLVGRNWARAISPDGHHAQESHVRYGSVAYAHGEASHIDAIRTAYAFAKDLNSLARNKRPVGRGANMSIYFSEQDEFYEEYMQLPSDLFIAEEEKIADMVENHGGKVSRALGLRALAVTRGDRYDSLKTLLRLTGAGGFDARVARYTQDYGEFTPNGRTV